MITEMKVKMHEMAAQTGNHKYWCAGQLAKAMSDEELTAFAAETGNKRYIATAQYVVSGINPRTGIDFTTKERADFRRDMINIVVANLTA